MTSRRWQNIAKYFFDISKLVLSITVVAPLVGRGGISLKVVALGALSGVLFLTMGLIFDRKGEADVHQ